MAGPSLGDIWNAVNQIISIITGVKNTQAQQATAQGVSQLEAAITVINGEIFSTSHGLAALNGKLDEVLTALGAPQQQGEPVTLPTTPPDGYGPGDADALVLAIWQYQLPGCDTMGSYMFAAGATAAFSTTIQPQFHYDEFFDYQYPGFDAFGEPRIFQPSFSWTLVSPGDTFLPSVIAQNPTAAFVDWAQGEGGAISVIGDGGDGPQGYLTRYDEASWNAVRDSIFSAQLSFLPPVWPGLDGVTLGDPVTITALLTIMVPMDGCLIQIDDVTTNKPEIPYGDQMAWRYLGALSFVSDNDFVEPWQPLAFSQALYTPRSMAHASGLVLRTDASVVGTVTPWVLNT